MERSEASWLDILPYKGDLDAARKARDVQAIR